MNITCAWDLDHAVKARDALDTLGRRAEALASDYRHWAGEFNCLHDAAESIEEVVLDRQTEAERRVTEALDEYQNSWSGG